LHGRISIGLVTTAELNYEKLELERLERL